MSGDHGDQAPQTVHHEGWLAKRNSWGVEWWNQRYFVLRESELSYFDAETDKTPKCRLDLADFTLAVSRDACSALMLAAIGLIGWACGVQSGMIVEDSVGKRNTLQLTVKCERIKKQKEKKRDKGSDEAEKVYTLAAPDEGEYARWVDALQRALERVREVNWLADAMESAD